MSEKILTPSDSDTAKALEALAQVEEDAHDADLTESIRTCILSLSIRLAEKEREVERCHDELESNSHSISELTKVIENYQKKREAHNDE